VASEHQQHLPAPRVRARARTGGPWPGRLAAPRRRLGGHAGGDAGGAGGHGPRPAAAPGLREPQRWLAGIVLASPVVDVACATPSFAWNCYREDLDTGDPDTGDCSSTPSMSDRIADCRWSYLEYFFGFPGILMADLSTASAKWEERSDFFEQGAVNPLRADLSRLPPLLLLAGTRDFYYSDSPRLAALACNAGVEVEVLHVVGAFHDFVEYSAGCGGPAPLEEALEAFRRIRAFTGRVLRARPGGSSTLTPAPVHLTA